MKTIQGDILKANVDAIAHQCNVTSPNVHGVAKFIFDKHPAAHTKHYFGDHSSPELGDIDIFPITGASYNHVINMYSQRYPGPPNVQHKDSKEYRLKWFRDCLNLIVAKKIDSVAFPYLIGCGLGGGNWPDYLKELEVFEEKFKRPVFLFQYNP